MFTTSVFLVAFILAGFSVCVESFGSDIIPIDHSVGALKGRSEGPSECFTEFSVSQANTVDRLGQAWENCTDSETEANKRLNQDSKKYIYSIAKVPNDICVGIDNDCRDKFAQDADIEAVLLCFENWAIPARQKLLELSEDCKMKRITIDNESRSIKATKKNCTVNANFEYLEESDYLFKNLINTCENSPPESSTTIATTTQFSKSPIQSTTPRISSTTGDDPALTTAEADPAWETDSTTRRSRFPWN